MTPTAIYNPFSGRVTIKLFGKDCGDMSIVTEEGHANISRMAREEGLDRIYAPRPVLFNAEICSIKDLTTEVDLGNGVTAMRGVDADGVFMEVGKRFYMGTADCITLVLLHPMSGVCIVAHAGRDCLFDRQDVLGKGKSRMHASVVDRAMSIWPPKARKHVKAFMTAGITPYEFDHSWDHPTHGTTNQAICADLLVKYGPTCLHGNVRKGKLVLSEIIRAQLIRAGVLPFNIGCDVVDTYDDADKEGNHLWWSYRRCCNYGEESKQRDGKKRNGVLVTLNW